MAVGKIVFANRVIPCQRRYGRERGKIGRYVIEFGLGMDFHGQDVNKAAQKAVKDAISKSCLCGLEEVLHLKDLSRDVRIEVILGVSDPAKIREEEIKACLPIGIVSVKAAAGGLQASGLYLPGFGDKDDSIEVAVACIEVWIDQAE